MTGLRSRASPQCQEDKERGRGGEQKRGEKEYSKQRGREFENERKEEIREKLCQPVIEAYKTNGAQEARESSVGADRGEITQQ